MAGEIPDDTEFKAISQQLALDEAAERLAVAAAQNTIHEDLEAGRITVQRFLILDQTIKRFIDQHVGSPCRINPDDPPANIDK